GVCLYLHGFVCGCSCKTVSSHMETLMLSRTSSRPIIQLDLLLERSVQCAHAVHTHTHKHTHTHTLTYIEKHPHSLTNTHTRKYINTPPHTSTYTHTHTHTHTPRHGQ